jgi:iron complex outermembrane receptor protein
MVLRLGWLVFAAGLAAFAPAAAAQDDIPATTQDQSGQDLQQVVVTARRREERLSDVPLAATVFDANALADRGGVNAARDLLNGVPGVRFNDTTSPLNSEVSMRGSSTARGTNSDPSVGLYRNGAWIGGGAVGGRSFTQLDLFDVNRVEVLRGTQGALYGRDAVGGAVNVVSAQPEFANSGYADVQYSPEIRAGQAEAVANIAVSSEAALRFGFAYVRQNKGYFYDPDNNVYFDEQRGFNLRGQGRWRSHGWDIDLLLERQHMTVPAIAFQVYIVPNTPTLAALYPKGFQEDPYVYPWNTPPVATQDVNTIMLTSTHAFEWARFTSTTMMRRRTSFYQFDADGIDPATLAAGFAAGQVSPTGAALTDPSSFSSTRDNSLTLSQDVHLNGSFGQDRFAWLAGAEIVNVRSNYETVAKSSPPAAPSNGARAPGRVNYISGSAYGSLGYDFTEKLNLTGEARLTADDKEARNNRYDLATGAQAGGDANNFNASTSSNNGSYNATLSYKLPYELLAYAKYGTSYRAGGFNTNLGDPRQPKPVPAVYSPEYSRAYELGIKGSPMPRLYVAVAGYMTHTRDVLLTDNNGCARGTACPVAATTFLTNAGTADGGWGVEFESKTRINLAGGRLTAGVGASRQQGGKIKDSPIASYSGRYVPQTPDWIASADLDYRHAFIGRSTIFGNVHYAGQWGGLQEISPPPLSAGIPGLDDFQIVDLRLGAGLDALEFAAFINNAGDVSYLTYQDGQSRRLSQPRTYGFEFRYTW